MRGRAAALLALALLALSGCHPEQAGEAPAFQNLVLVMVDTLRSDHLPSYGYSRDTAPCLARLAAEGIQVQGYAVTSWTRPSVASLLTGLAPQRHQAISRSDHMPAATPYLPDLLARAGFHTAGYIGNVNSGREWGFDRGFERYHQVTGVRKADARRVTDGALTLAQDLRSPFFLYAHYVDPHDPYRPRQVWPSPASAGKPLIQPRRIAREGIALTPEVSARLRDQYDGEILEFDRELERLLAALREQGLLRRTLVVVTSDHGEEFGEHGGMTHGHTLYEEVLRVPFVLWAEKGLPSYRSDDVFALLDFLPTALAALGQPAPAGLDGRDRWPELVAGRLGEGRRPLYSHLDLDRRGLLAVLDFPAKLVHGTEAPHTRLYDLAADPREVRPETGGSGRAGELLPALLHQHNRLSRQAFERRASAVEGELRKSLAALGYLQLSTPNEELRERAIPARLGPHGLTARPEAPGG